MPHARCAGNRSALSRPPPSGKIEIVRTWLATLSLIGCGDAPVSGHAPFWRVETAAGASLLLGTIHGGVDPTELPDLIWEQVAAARAVVTETDTTAINGNELITAVTLNESLRQLTTVDEWRTIVASELGAIYPHSILERRQPWYLHGILINALIPAHPPVDVAVADAGRAAGVELLFLEHWREQVDMLNALGIEDGLEQLLRVASDQELAREVFDDWAAAYQAGDVRWLAELVMHPDAVLHRPRYYDEIVFGRNRDWLPVVERELDGGDAVVAVGFAHMLGDAGLVALLRGRGYRITKVPPP